MNELDFLEKIRQSAQADEIPEGLRPEQIERKLESSSQGRKKHVIRRWAAGAGAAACVGLAVFSWFVSSQTGDMKNQMESAESQAVADSAPSSDEKADAGTEGEIAAAEDVEKVMASAADYQQVYDTVKYPQAEAYKEDRGILGTISDWISGGSTSDAMEKSESTADTAAAPESGAATNDQAAGADTSADSADGSSYSDTNVREAGVDEADIVKTDGKYIYLVTRQGMLQIVEARGGDMKLASTIRLEAAGEGIQEMYVDGDVLSVITSDYETALYEREKNTYDTLEQQTTHLYTYDISDRTKVRQTGHISQEGYYQSSRKSGQYVYLFTNYTPYNTEDPEAVEEYIPRVNGELLPAEDIYLPREQNISSYIVITSVDTGKPDKVQDTKALVAGSDMMYVSSSNIYITRPEWSQGGNRTSIVRFAYKEGKIKAEAAASVNGYLNDSFSLDEYEGNLRLVLTASDARGVDTNGLYILDQKLEVTGKIENLAEGERIKSARFMGDKGYFVTFRNTDPLFSVDLSDPQNPAVLGELKIPGFSEYLHYYGDNLLLGIGRDADPETGKELGLKLSMFDISDPSNVTEKSKMILDAVSEYSVAANYKAIMIDPEKNLFGFAYTEGGYSPSGEYPNAYYGVFSYEEGTGFVNKLVWPLYENQEDHYGGFTDARGLYIDNTIYIYNGSSLTAFDMNQEYQQTGKLEW